MDINNINTPQNTQKTLDSKPNAATTNSATKSSESNTAISSDFETFLKMLTTQLENQDPLDPVKSEDFAVQLATFSGVEQQVLTNDLLESILSQSGLSGISQYADWVGMEVRAPVAGYFDGSPITISPSPEKTAQNAVLVVENARGEEVQRVSIPVSQEPVAWNGQLNNGVAPNGLYNFRVESYKNGSLASTTAAELYTRVTEVQNIGGKAMVIAEGGVSIEADSVSAIRQ